AFGQHSKKQKGETSQRKRTTTVRYGKAALPYQLRRLSWYRWRGNEPLRTNTHRLRLGARRREKVVADRTARNGRSRGSGWETLRRSGYSSGNALPLYHG